MGLGAGLDGSEKSRPLQSSKPGPSGPRRVAVPTKLCGPVFIYEDERKSIVHFSCYIAFSSTSAKNCRDSVIWNILQYLDSIHLCFSVRVPRRESASRSVQMSFYIKWYQSSENNHLLRQIEHSTRCGIKYNTVVLEFVLNMFLPFQAIQVLEGTRVRIRCEAIHPYFISSAFVAVYLLSSGFPA
jgi:hypothetical protein